jgi:hypothetical protein
MNAIAYPAARFFRHPRASGAITQLRSSRTSLRGRAKLFARPSIMEITKEQLIAMANAISLDMAEGDLENVRVRLSTLLTEMEGIERELGPQMDQVEPVPPVYPREEF